MREKIDLNKTESAMVGYGQLSAAPDIEVYGVDNYHHEVWLPVIKADCRMEK